LKQESFDVLLVGDHSQIKAVPILRELSVEGGSLACFILQGATKTDIELFRELGVVDVIPKRDPVKVLEQVKAHCAGEAFRATTSVGTTDAA
jgi:hypothetical protein